MAAKKEPVVFKQLAANEPQLNFYVTLEGKEVYCGKMDRNATESLKEYGNRLIDAQIVIGTNSVMICLGRKAPCVPDVGEQITF